MRVVGQKLPEGMRMLISVFVTDDDTGLQMRVDLNGLTTIPTILAGDIETGRIVDAVRKMGADLPGTGWRVMTRAEIKEYLADEEPEDEFDTADGDYDAEDEGGEG